MTTHSLFAEASGVIVAVLTILAVAAFVAVDIVRLAGRPSDPAWLKRCSSAAWPLGIVAVVLAIVRVLVLA